jgi:hypothetical protein
LNDLKKSSQKNAEATETQRAQRKTEKKKLFFEFLCDLCVSVAHIGKGVRVSA